MSDQNPPDPDNPDQNKEQPSQEGFSFPPLHEEESPTESAEKPVQPETKTGGPTVFLDPARRWLASHRIAGLVIGFFALAFLMYGISVLRRDLPDEDAVSATLGPDVIPINAVEVRMGRFQDEINAVGNLKGEVEIELRFEVDGTIQEFGVYEGAKVNPGQLIARLNDRDAQLKIERARIELEQTEKLFILDGVSRTKLNEARLNLAVAQSEFDKTRIVARREGILADRSADVGEFVTPQRKIATLVAIRNVIVEIGIIERLIDKVFPGQKINLIVDAYPGTIFEGNVETISPMIAGDGSKTFSIRAKIPNPDSLLLPGMFARARIITYESDDAISIPNNALVKTSGGFQVFIVNADDVAEARDVEVGYVATETAQINSGLNAGEIVIVQKPPELKAGSKVKVIEVQKP